MEVVENKYPLTRVKYLFHFTAFNARTRETENKENKGNLIEICNIEHPSKTTLILNNAFIVVYSRT